MTNPSKYKDFETAINRLEEITNLLETGEVKLEEAIKLYTEGLEIAGFCDKKLSEAEKKVKIINEKNKTLVEEEFAETEDKE
ncbi:MAG: exodeoxyribonuclease VII small subunit [candidate division Zixibacteria bacterium]|nr:exodeoxyribonuclease VII small subunit [candidate division Zixibacteria bacterium]MDD5425882.1 exodeoxyribonuclease VII small subunit [candidate division Zixibacteria bacterium]